MPANTTQQISAVLVAMYQGFSDSTGFRSYQGIAAERVATNAPALTDGKIAYEETARNEQSFYPRMMVIPDGITVPGGGGREAVNTRPSMTQPVVPVATLTPLAAKWLDFRLELWGQDPDDCVDLFDQFFRALSFVVSTGSYKIGTARHSKPGVSTAGRRLYVRFSWYGVITQQPIPLPIQYAPAGITSGGTAFVDNAGNPTGTQGVSY